jgi:hypothetical protein
MTTDTSNDQDVTLDVGPMTETQKNELCKAVADFLVRSGQIRRDAVLTGPHLVQFLSEAADAAEERTKPIDPASVTMFGTDTEFSGRGEHFVSTPEDFMTKRTLDGSFDECCSALHVVENAVEKDGELAEAIAALLNRAYWLGQDRCAPLHVTPFA